VILSLFTVRNDRRACGLKPLNGISNRIFIKRFKTGILTAGSGDPLDEIAWPWDTAIGSVGMVIAGGVAIHAAFLKHNLKHHSAVASARELFWPRAVPAWRRWNR
jgi:hypothetical protein